jgi:RNA polymerase sigma factor (sigma-70 family)
LQYRKGDVVAVMGPIANAERTDPTGTVDRGHGFSGAVESIDTRADRSQDVASWVSAAESGDKAAWQKLVDRFAPTVWAVARGHRLSAADAADVSQTTWLRLVEHLGRIEQPERVGAWLATTARRESLRVLRLSGRQVPNGDDFEHVLDVREDTARDEVLISDHRAAIVTDLVAKLPVRSQTLLRLLSADTPLSYKEISEALDMPIGSIGPTRARALDRLKGLAVQAGIDPSDLFS